jgi:hypothetical protein
MELRKCCNHPFLIRGAEERILADATEQAKSVKLEGQELHVDHVQIFSDRLVKSSGKMVLINKVCLQCPLCCNFDVSMLVLL